MKLVIIWLIVVCAAVAVYAVATCPEILNALAKIKNEALNNDNCVVTSTCSGVTATKTLTCSYGSRLTEVEQSKCF